MRSPLHRLTAGLPRPLELAVEWLVTIAGALAVVLALKAWVINPYRIPTSSMEPSLHCAAPQPGCQAGISDRVLANRLAYHFREPRRGEVVVFKTPALAKRRCRIGGVFVKRLIGLPGEAVSERDGVIFIEGKRLQEPWVAPARRGRENSSWIVPSGYYFMLGDNRRDSCDSRTWGPVARDSLIGPVVATYWPPRRVSVG